MKRVAGSTSVRKSSPMARVCPRTVRMLGNHVCHLTEYGSTGRGTWTGHASGTYRGHAKKTRRCHARSSTRKSGVRPQHPRQCQSTGLALLRQQRVWCVVNECGRNPSGTTCLFSALR
eukprot:2095998-Prymnesium_polylepis.1